MNIFLKIFIETIDEFTEQVVVPTFLMIMAIILVMLCPVLVPLRLAYRHFKGR